MEIINKKSFFGIFLIVVFIIVLLYIPHKTEEIKLVSSIKYVQIAGQSIQAELALTPVAREQGLSGRTDLKEDEGMLFIFDHPDKYSFWMKDMNFSIDMIWISEDMKVLYIKKNATPESFPQAYGPETDAKYILEVVSGFSDKNNLKVGDVANFIY